MNISVSVEQRFDLTPDGTVWTNSTFDYQFWTRYLEVFDTVKVIARVHEVESVVVDSNKASGDGVTFSKIPYYVGPWQYLQRSARVSRAIDAALVFDEAIILRVPSHIATLIEPRLTRRQYPFGVEVVGDPYDIFSPGAIKHPLRSFFRWRHVKQQQKECTNACAVAYVTRGVLQQRYPPRSNAFSINYSSVYLPDEAFVNSAKELRPDSVCLVTVGSLEHYNKGIDVLIDACSICCDKGLKVRLEIIGNGRHRAELEAYVRIRKLESNVVFVGQLPPGSPVRERLDRADLFVLPSRTEGLPRALIEAMARGLPCIGSAVGGIPELLPPEDLVPPGDALALADKIADMVTNPERLTRSAARNLEAARTYHEDILRARRIAFYRHVREETQQWLEK